MPIRFARTRCRVLAATAVALAFATPRVSEAQTCPPSTAGRALSPRDPRSIVARHRAVALLVTEVQALGSLYASTSPTAPARAELLRRTAEDYVELENAALDEKTQAEAAHDAARAAERASKTVFDRRKAIDDYVALANDYPSYSRLDEVHYYLGIERERDGDLSTARRDYFTLLSRWPASPLVPLAYLAFADLFFDEATGDPSKWELAAQAYMKVIGFPPPQNSAYGYAWYRLAHVKWHQGDTPAADQAFAKASTYATSYPTLTGSSELGRAAGADSAILRSAPAQREACP